MWLTCACGYGPSHVDARALRPRPRALAAGVVRDQLQSVAGHDDVPGIPQRARRMRSDVPPRARNEAADRGRDLFLVAGLVAMVLRRELSGLAVDHDRLDLAGSAETPRGRKREAWRSEVHGDRHGV